MAVDIYFTSTATFQIVILCNHTVSVSLRLLGARGLYYRSSVEALQLSRLFLSEKWIKCILRLIQRCNSIGYLKTNRPLGSLHNLQLRTLPYSVFQRILLSAL